MDNREFVVIVDDVVQKIFSVPSDSKSAVVKEVTGLSDIEVGTKYNPATQGFYCDLQDSPSAEI